jgi:alpha-tubulin suppressor-like RCC1 family protein
MSIAPSNKTLFVGESIQFGASGGTGPYVFEIDSGIGLVSGGGFYTAPSVAGSSVVKATDAKGEEAYATVSVAIQISLSPTSATINEGDTISMSGSGGIPPYTYSIVAGDGSLNSLSGLFDATGVSSGSAVIEVRDSSSNTAFAAITINPSLIISPQVQTIGYNEPIAFTASGGDIPYVYSILTGNGTVNSSTGQFVGPATVGTTVVRVTDNSGNSVDSIIATVDSPQIIKPRDIVAINRTVTFTATNGAPGYTYSIVSGTGSIHPITGVFTAPSDTDTTIVQVRDVNNYTDSTSIDTFVPKKLGLGDGHTCVINFSDINTSISKCWGRSSYGVGNGGHAGPEKNYFLMDDVAEFGDNLPSVDLGPGVLVRGVKVGRYSTCAVTTNDKMKCFGYNNYGQLGLGDRTYRGFAKSHMGSSLEFVDLGAGRTVNNILPFEDVLSVNYHSTCVILDDNSTKCWGIGSKGKTGHGNTATRGDGATEVGDGIPILDFGPDNAIQISVGLEHTCAVLQNNNVKCWGESNYGQLGRNSTADQVVKPTAATPVDLGTGHTATKVSTGYYHTCVVLDDGRVKCWGRNNYGQLGYGSTATLGDGASEMGDNLGYVDLGTSKTAVDIELQGYSSCALLNDATVKCWGYNAYGNLGVGSTANLGDASSEMGDVLITVDLGAGRTATNIYSGINQTCAKLDNGDVKCWGRNNTAQLGQGHTFDIGKSALSLGDNLAAINLSSTASITTIQSNEHTTCAVLSDNKLKCFGADYYGSRGTGSSIVGDEASDMGSNLAALDVGSNNPFKDIRSDQFVTCGQTTDNKLACWGTGAEGSRGSGNGTNRGYLASHWGDNLEFINFGSGGLTVKTFDVGYRGACAILSDDSLACWGRNDNAAGGHGTAADKGGAASHIGDNWLFTNVGNVSTPVEVSRTYYNTCARFANGGIKCWGLGSHGQNGVGSTAQLGDAGSEMGNNLPFINYGTGILSTGLCGGERFNCSLFNNGGVKCWGRNNVGQLGIGSTASIGDHSSELGNALQFVDLGTGRTATKIACGRYHACALLDNEKMKCWGEAGSGQLGNGSTADVGNSPGEMGDNLPEINLGTGRLVLDISAGEQATCAVLDNNTVKCWGRNGEGQLGLGHLTNMGTLDVTMGDSLPAVETD